MSVARPGPVLICLRVPGRVGGWAAGAVSSPSPPPIDHLAVLLCRPLVPVSQRTRYSSVSPARLSACFALQSFPVLPLVCSSLTSSFSPRPQVCVSHPHERAGGGRDAPGPSLRPKGTPPASTLSLTLRGCAAGGGPSAAVSGFRALRSPPGCVRPPRVVGRQPRDKDRDVVAAAPDRVMGNLFPSPSESRGRGRVGGAGPWPMPSWRPGGVGKRAAGRVTLRAQVGGAQSGWGGGWEGKR